MARRVRFPDRFLPVITILLIACDASQTSVPAPLYNAAQIQLQLQNGIVVNKGHPFTGTIYTLQPNKKDTAETIGFREGREHGQWKRFYSNGRLQWTRVFDNGQKTGVYLAWWPNGKRQLLYHFKNGEYEGQCREWNEKGVLVKEANYVNGYEAGPQKQFYDNGKLRSNYVMIDGRRYGLLGTKNCVNVSDSIFK